MDDVSREEFDRIAAADGERERFEFYDGDVLLLARFATLDDRCNPHRIYVSGEDNVTEASTYIGLPDYSKVFDGIVFHHLDVTIQTAEQGGLAVEDRIALQEIHELCHWALSDEENSALDPDGHSRPWNMRIVAELEFVTGEELPHPTPTPTDEVPF
ncbi:MULTISPECIES: hypothetical protein [unclassified Haloferax]|jgi:hypothetical protein|uniref:hypothetical protein n=1 Tax=unclassified Haloferax TaxID=2625095 RepID=UPI00287705F6|nr:MULTISPECIES: hypothetical protein [unclassified Haloferax]MDS0243150.1 hypothetical protein [Haloferax sp. S2CR25]MDS0446271.1 hypothetical protein [Haloferax sp. S2CR25-2]